MVKFYKPVDLEYVRTYSLEERPTKVDTSRLAKPCLPNTSMQRFVDSLPKLLKANELRVAINAIVEARKLGRPVVVGMGGHVVKCGLGPIIVQMMEANIITAVCMNGGASIHDFELALTGQTSEDVADTLRTGMFGMVYETGVLMNEAISTGVSQGQGLGYSLGAQLLKHNPKYVENSILAASVRLGLPATVHVAIGGDTIHMHPSADGAALGQGSLFDFRLLSAILLDFEGGGVYLNIGSAVVLPEVFLKALNLARNLSDDKIDNFTTINMDMIQHYRPLQNVVSRPTQNGGHGLSLTGHHEIMVPLLFHCILAEFDEL